MVELSERSYIVCRNEYRSTEISKLVVCQRQGSVRIRQIFSPWQLGIYRTPFPDSIGRLKAGQPDGVLGPASGCREILTVFQLQVSMDYRLPCSTARVDVSSVEDYTRLYKIIKHLPQERLRENAVEV